MLKSLRFGIGSLSEGPVYLAPIPSTNTRVQGYLRLNKNQVEIQATSRETPAHVARAAGSGNNNRLEDIKLITAVALLLVINGKTTQAI